MVGHISKSMWAAETGGEGEEERQVEEEEETQNSHKWGRRHESGRSWERKMKILKIHVLKIQ